MVSRTLMSSERLDWVTPWNLFNPIKETYSLNFDAAAQKHNAKLPSFISPEDNALTCRWADYGTRAWLNPPYGRETGKFIDAAVRSLDDGVELVVALVAARTDTVWFFRAMERAQAIWLLKGRIKFGESKSSAPFPSAIIIWNRTGEKFGIPDKRWPMIMMDDWAFTASYLRERGIT